MTEENKLKNLDLIVHKYQEYLEIKHIAQRTIANRLWCLDKFLWFLKESNVLTANELTPEVLKSYQKYRHYYENNRGKRDQPITINTHLLAVKSFLRFLAQDNYLPHDLSDYLEYVKEPKRLPGSVLTDAQVKRILDLTDTTTKIGFRDRTILEVLYSTGIRRNELINLKLDDVDYGGGYLRVNQGKGNKDRMVPLGKIACHYVENWIKSVRRLFLNDRPGDYLFLTKTGGPMDGSTVRDIIIKYSAPLKLNYPVTCHTFRRSCATEMIKRNANLMHVKEILGHEDLESTKVYCKLTITDLKKTHQRYHPRERDKDGIL